MSRNVKRFRAAVAAVALSTAALTLTACGGTGAAAGAGGETVTVYSADGLAGWYKTQFAAFTEETGIAVNLVEAGSGEVGLPRRQGTVEPAGRRRRDTAAVHPEG